MRGAVNIYRNWRRIKKSKSRSLDFSGYHHPRSSSILSLGSDLSGAATFGSITGRYLLPAGREQPATLLEFPQPTEIFAPPASLFKVLETRKSRRVHKVWWIRRMESCSYWSKTSSPENSMGWCIVVMERQCLVPPYVIFFSRSLVNVSRPT